MPFPLSLFARWSATAAHESRRPSAKNGAMGFSPTSPLYDCNHPNLDYDLASTIAITLTACGRTSWPRCVQTSAQVSRSCHVTLMGTCYCDHMNSCCHCSLDMRFHVERRTGSLNRIVERCLHHRARKPTRPNTLALTPVSTAGLAPPRGS